MISRNVKGIKKYQNITYFVRKTVPMPESFPTPMEEPRKVMRALFLGAVQVDKPCGIDVIHGAIDQVSHIMTRQFCQMLWQISAHK